MDNKEIFKIVEKTAKEQLGIPEKQIIDPNAKFMDDLGADSVDTVEIAMMLEDEFHIEISDDYLVDSATVSQVVAYISRQLAGKTKQLMQPSVADFQI